MASPPPGSQAKRRVCVAPYSIEVMAGHQCCNVCMEFAKCSGIFTDVLILSVRQREHSSSVGLERLFASTR